MKLLKSTMLYISVALTSIGFILLLSYLVKNEASLLASQTIVQVKKPTQLFNIIQLMFATGFASSLLFGVLSLSEIILYSFKNIKPQQVND